MKIPKLKQAATAALLFATQVGCSGAGQEAGGGPAYALYHGTEADPSTRIHWATFDADGPGHHNPKNCSHAAEMLNSVLREHGHSEGRSWCEPAAPGQASGEGAAYVLFHNAASDPSARIHWATFIADKPSDDPAKKCIYAVELLSYFQWEEGREGEMRFWCEAKLQAQ